MEGCKLCQLIKEGAEKGLQVYHCEASFLILEHPSVGACAISSSHKALFTRSEKLRVVKVMNDLFNADSIKPYGDEKGEVPYVDFFMRDFNDHAHAVLSFS